MHVVGYVVFGVGAVLMFSESGGRGPFIALVGTAITVWTQLRILRYAAARQQHREAQQPDQPS